MKTSLLNFYLFLKKPTLLKTSKNRKELAIDFWTVFLLDLLFSVLLVGLFYALLHFKLIKEYSGPDLLKEYGVLSTLAFACILAPL